MKNKIKEDMYFEVIVHSEYTESFKNVPAKLIDRSMEYIIADTRYEKGKVVLIVYDDRIRSIRVRSIIPLQEVPVTKKYVRQFKNFSAIEKKLIEKHINDDRPFVADAKTHIEETKFIRGRLKIKEKTMKEGYNIISS